MHPAAAFPGERESSSRRWLLGPLLHSAFVAAALALLPCLASHAALEKYRLRRSQIEQLPEYPGPPEFVPGCRNAETFSQQLVIACRGQATLDVDASAPSLRHFAFLADWTGTVRVFTDILLFLSTRERTSARDAPATGGTAAGQTLRWGVVSGWSISGAHWCHSIGSAICTVAMRMDQATTEPPLDSPFYDLGTWTFHGTGFTATPFVQLYFTGTSGNGMLLYSGFRVLDGTVPALPLAGRIGLGAALAAGAAAALRRARSKASSRASIARLGGSALILSLLPAVSDAALEKYRLRRTLATTNVAGTIFTPNPALAPRCQDANDPAPSSRRASTPAAGS